METIKLQKKIRLLAVCGLLTTGVLVGLTTALPIYRDARERIDIALGYNVRSQAQTLAQLFGRQQEIAAQITSRTQIRDALARYNRWEISLSELASFSLPRLRDAINQSGDVVGLVRLDALGDAVLQLGLPIPEAARPAAAAIAQQPVLRGPVVIGDAPYMVVGAPILARDGERVGTDLFAFELRGLPALLRGGFDAGQRLHHYLVDGDAGTVTEILPVTGVLAVGVRDDWLLDRLRKAETTPWREAERMLFHSAIPGVPGWTYAVTAAPDALYAPALGELGPPLLTIAALVVTGALLTSWAMRPFARRVVEQQAELRLAASVLEGSQEGILILDAGQRILRVNQAACRITGHVEHDLKGRQLCEVLCPGSTHAGCCQTMGDATTRPAHWRGEIDLRRKDGTTFPARMTITAVPDSAGSVVHHVAIFADISAQKAAEDRIRHLAHFDGVTDLPNRALLQDRLGHALERMRRTEQTLAVLFIDLDHFKEVNDRYGHAAGDRLLRVVAQRLSASVRDEDTVGRLGGDEFLVMLEAVPSPQEAALVAIKLIAALSAPVTLDEHAVQVGASIGISLFPADGADATTLVKHADAAMYRAKEAGRNTYRFYSDDGVVAPAAIAALPPGALPG